MKFKTRLLHFILWNVAARGLLGLIGPLFLAYGAPLWVACLLAAILGTAGGNLVQYAIAYLHHVRFVIINALCEECEACQAEGCDHAEDEEDEVLDEIEDLQDLVAQLLSEGIPPCVSHPARARQLGRLDRERGAARRSLPSITALLGVEPERLPRESREQAEVELRAAYDAAFDDGPETTAAGGGRPMA